MFVLCRLFPRCSQSIFGGACITVQFDLAIAQLEMSVRPLSKDAILSANFEGSDLFATNVHPRYWGPEVCHKSKGTPADIVVGLDWIVPCGDAGSALTTISSSGGLCIFA